MARLEYRVTHHGLGSIQITSGPVNAIIDGEEVHGHFEGDPSYSFDNGVNIVRQGEFEGQKAELRIRPSGAAWLQLLPA